MKLSGAPFARAPGLATDVCHAHTEAVVRQRHAWSRRRIGNVERVWLDALENVAARAVFFRCDDESAHRRRLVEREADDVRPVKPRERAVPVRLDVTWNDSLIRDV